ncbi:MAG: rRNA maturation RNase YbeY [Verrucomicrobiota bacterium]|jgi:rRNA maturation RNase YbeY
MKRDQEKSRLDRVSPDQEISLQLSNRQKTRRIHLAVWRRVVLRLLDQFPAKRWRISPAEGFPASGRLGVHLINAKEMTRLNEEFLGHAGSTDVITFNYQEGTEEKGLLDGEIFISVDDAVACAPRFRTRWQSELVRYLAHGVLHLQGYDDDRPAARRKMKKLENRLLKQLSREKDWGRLERLKNETRRK